MHFKLKDSKETQQNQSKFNPFPVTGLHPPTLYSCQSLQHTKTNPYSAAVVGQDLPGRSDGASFEARPTVRLGVPAEMHRI